MTSSYKPTQEQDGKLPPQGQGQLRRFVAPSANGKQTQLPATPQPAPSTPAPKLAGPAQNIPSTPRVYDHLPTGLMPSTANGTGAPQQAAPIGANGPKVQPSLTGQGPRPGQQGKPAQPGQPSFQSLRDRSQAVQQPPLPNTPLYPANVPMTPRENLFPGQDDKRPPTMPTANGNNMGGGVQQRQRTVIREQAAALGEPEMPMERVGNNLVLYRSPNFYVRTAYRPTHTRNPLQGALRTTATAKSIVQQEQRIASSETRFMPVLEAIAPPKKWRIPIPPWIEAIVLIIGMLISLVAHAYNMFNFPRYELDEGTYMSNAWAILNGMVQPYAYGYGHPPAAWIQIAVWVQLTGGFFTFGNALNSGRVLMLFYGLGCSLLIYLIVRRLGASRSAGLLAMIVFSLSPLSITYQRQTLLDNVGIFWLLLSLYLIVIGNSRLPYLVGAAVAFGIAFLSKEIFVLFVPVLFYAVWLHTTKFQRKFALITFGYTAIAVCSAFVLMAVLRSELFPKGVLPWDTHDHLSMIGTFINQAKRTQTEGKFIDSWNTWFQSDPLFMICSIAIVAFNIIVGWWNRKQLMLALFAVSFWLLLIRGGVVLSFYLIPLIPLVAMNVAFAVNTIMGWLGRLVRIDLVRVILVLGVIAGLIPYDLQAATVQFTQHATSAQTQAMSWVRTHIPRTSFVVINGYMFMDMRESGGASVGDGAPFPFAHIYFNVATDPAVRDTILNGNPDRIDYIIADSEMMHDIQGSPGRYDIIIKALHNSIVVAHFTPTDNSKNGLEITIYQVQHKFVQPVVSTDPGTHGKAVQIADRGTIPIDRPFSLG